MFAASKTDSVSSSIEPFNYVTMLLHGDGTNGAQNNTFVDSSASPFSITRNGNTTQGSFSPYGSNWSNFFVSGSTAVNYLVSNSLSLSGTFTIEGYVNWDGVGSNPNMFTLGDSFQSTGIEVYSSGGSWIVYSGGATRITGSTAVVGQWTYIAVTRTGSTVTLYINGVSQGTWTSSATFSGTIKVGAEFYDGVYYSSMSGYISNFRVNNTTAINTVPIVPLTAVSGTIFLTCQSNRFIDNSVNTYAITVNGTPSVQRFNPFGTSTAYSTSVIGGSGYFDGAGDNLSVAANSSNLGTGDFNITFWINLTAAPSNGVPATNAYNANVFTNGWYFYTGDGTSLSFGLGSASGADAVTATVNMINQWHYIEVTRSGSTLSIYVDGVFATSKSNTKSGSVSGNVTRIGARYDGTSGLIQGYITDFKVVVGTAGNTSNYTPPTAPASATGSTLMLSMKNAAIFDNAMMNNLETVGNAQISTSVKKYGTGSLAFDGTGDFLRPPLSPMANLGGDFTIEFWAYLNDQDAQDFLGTATWAYYIGAGKSGWSVSYTSSKVSFSYQNNNSYIIATAFNSTTLSSSTWNHVAVVRNNGVIKCYVNGVASATTISSSTNFVSTTYGVWVGAAGDADTYGYELNGYLDDVRITNGYARYTTNFTPPTVALTDTGPY
jgi:hypothetical protein